MYAIADKWMLVQKLRIPKVQPAYHMKLKMKEDQSMDTLILVGKWIKTLMAHSQPMR